MNGFFTSAENYLVSTEELQDLEILKGIIGPTTTLSSSSEDERTWLPSPSGSFSKSYYTALTKIDTNGISHKFIWNKRLPTKINFFLWTVAFSKCLTTDNLRKRGQILVNGCVLCKADEETVQHVLLHCPIAWRVWSNLIPQSVGTWTMPPSLMDLGFSWKCRANWSDQQITSGAWYQQLCVGLYIWLERNSRVHKGKYESVDMICNNAKGFIFNWSALAVECSGLRYQNLIFEWDSLVSN